MHRILIIDDEDDIREVRRLSLENCCWLGSNGREVPVRKRSGPKATTAIFGTTPFFWM